MANKIFAEGFLKQFLEARASGTASPDEMERLKQAAQEQSAKLNESGAFGGTVVPFPSSLDLK